MTSIAEPQKAEQVQQWIRDAAQHIDFYERHGVTYASLSALESDLEAKRPTLKEQIKRRLIEATPSLSATRADEAVRVDEEYLKYVKYQRDTVLEKDDAMTRMVSAKLRAELAIAAVKAVAGMV